MAYKGLKLVLQGIYGIITFVMVNQGPKKIARANKEPAQMKTTF